MATLTVACGVSFGLSSVVSATPKMCGYLGPRFSLNRFTKVAALPCAERVFGLTVQAKQGSVNVNACSFEDSVTAVLKKWTKSDWAQSTLRNASFLAMNAFIILPALAEEEKGKIFDFNLTLPIMAVQFLLLMVALDTIWFKPVAAVMDSRDEEIRKMLLGVRDNSGEIKLLQEEAEAIIKAARAETTLALNKTKKETAAALEEKLKESRARIEEELVQSLANLEEQKEETLRGLEKQVQSISEEIIRKVIPFSV